MVKYNRASRDNPILNDIQDSGSWRKVISIHKCKHDLFICYAINGCDNISRNDFDSKSFCMISNCLLVSKEAPRVTVHIEDASTRWKTSKRIKPNYLPRL